MKLRQAQLLLTLVLLSACAGAPVGMQYANPNCVYRCSVTVVDASGAPALEALTATQGSVGGAVTRNRTTTLTDTDTGTITGGS